MPFGAAISRVLERWLTSGIGCSGWEDPRYPLHLALAFQVLTFLTLFLMDEPYGAAGWIGGTVGCLLNSLRLQRQRERAHATER